MKKLNVRHPRVALQIEKNRAHGRALLEGVGFVGLGVVTALLIVGVTRTINIDLWNYWHFAFLGAMVYFTTGSLAWAFYAAIVLYVITLCMADFTAKRFSNSKPQNLKTSNTSLFSIGMCAVNFVRIRRTK